MLSALTACATPTSGAVPAYLWRQVVVHMLSCCPACCCAQPFCQFQSPRCMDWLGPQWW